MRKPETFKELQEQYGGKYIAVYGNMIIAQATTFDEVKQKVIDIYKDRRGVVRDEIVYQFVQPKKAST